MLEFSGVEASCMSDAHVALVSRDHTRAALALLSKFGNPRISAEQWGHVLSPPWSDRQEHVGLGLWKGAELIGFVGTLYRPSKGGEQRVCSLSSLIVDTAHREHAMRLVLATAKLGVTTTILTPVRSVYEVALRIGFSIMDDTLRVIPALPGVRSSCEIELNAEVFGSQLDGGDLRRVTDHQNTLCRSVYLKHQKGSCLLIVRIATERKLAYAFVLYASRPEVLHDVGQSAVNAICASLGVKLLLCDQRLLPEPVGFGLAIPGAVRRLYLSDDGSGAPDSRLDNLYSEFAVLDIGATRNLKEMLSSASSRLFRARPR